MSKTPQELFTGLQIGDLLMVPVTLPKSKEQLTAFAAVLRIGDEGEFYLGRLSEHRPDPRPDSCNPYRWSADKGALSAQGSGQSAFPLAPAGRDVFEFAQAGIVIRFERDDAGKVIALALEQGGHTMKGTRK